MSAEEGGSSPSAPVTTTLAETGPAPASPGAPLPEPMDEIERRITERAPVAQMDAATATTRFDVRRKQLEANPRLLDDPEFMRVYGALAAKERGADLQDVLQQDLRQLRPDGRLPSPPADLRSDLTAEQVALRLGAAQDADGDGPEGDWNVAEFNAGVDLFRSYGMPGHAADELAHAEWHLARRVWTAEDAQRALEAEHGREQARAMISNAEWMLRRLAKDPVGRARIARWERQDERHLNNPELIARLDKLTRMVDAGNAKWMALEEAIVAEDRAAAQARAVAAARREQAEAQERTERLRAVQQQIESNHRLTRGGR